MSSNITNGQGGAIWAAGATTYVENSTIQGNLANDHAGIANENGAVTIVENSIIAQNTAGSSPDVYKNQGAFTPTGPNLIGVNGNASAEFPASPLDPMLHPLTDNGGPTLTRAPIPGSPVIDAAVLTVRSPLTDQRGSYRAGGPDNDLGTVELSECGNGVLRAGEACDDGNYVNGDCCSVYCTFEVSGSTCDADGSACTSDICDGAGVCTAGAPLVCDDGNACTTADTCSAGACVGGPPPPPPGSVPVLAASDRTTWNWTPDVDASGCDVVRGDLGLLRSSGADFVSSTTDCLGNDMAGTTLVDAAPVTCALGGCPCWPGGPQQIAALHGATHPITSCGIGSAAPTPDRSCTALFSYNDAVTDEYATQVFTGYFGRPVGQDYCQSYNSCYVWVDTCPPNGCFVSQPCDPGIWNPPVDVDLAITPGENAACIQALEAAEVILGCN